MEGFVDPVAHAAKANPVAPAVQAKPTVPVDASSAFKQRVADVHPQSINPFVLPVELWIIIFGFLDETTQAIAMHVCHEWHTLIMNISGTPRILRPRIFDSQLVNSISLLQWQHSLYPIDTHDRSQPHFSPLLYYAINSGNFDSVKWICENGFEWEKDECAAIYAATTGNITILEYVHTNLQCYKEGAVCSNAAKGGHYNCLKFAFENGYPFKTKTTNILLDAIKGGSLVCLKYIVDKGLLFDEAKSDYYTYAAIETGNLDIVKVLVECNLHFNQWDFATAADLNYANIFTFLYENGCEWTELVQESATASGDSEIRAIAATRSNPQHT